MIVHNRIKEKHGKWTRILRRDLEKRYGNFNAEHDDFISTSFFDAVVQAAKWESDFRRDNIRDVDGAIFFRLRRRCRDLAYRAARAKRNSTRTDLETQVENEEGKVFEIQKAFVPPEQIEVVWLKQMLERVGRASPCDREILALIFDRASVSEIAAELGLTERLAEARVANALKAVSTASE